MNVNQSHPKSFFKYMSASTAEIVLTNRTLRWSHPDKFDDSLDVAQAVLDAKKNLSTDISRIITDINKCWVENIRNDFRILCLGIENNNHRLWNDYAEAYKGAVIELACREESDSPWRIAEPVEYVKEKELYLTAKDWRVVLSLKGRERGEYIIKKCSLRKAKDNKHKWFEQNEWRIPSFRRPHEICMVSDYGVNPNDLTAIYFGHKMDIETQNKLLRLLYGNLGHVSAFRCELDSSQKITFSNLK